MKKYTNTVFATVLACITTLSFSQTWNQIESGTNKKLNCIDFVGNQVGYIGGDDSLLLKTIDGGVTWNPITFTGVDFMPNGAHILNLDFVTPEIGFMTVGPYTGSYKTVDGGTSWVNLDPWGSLCYNQGLYFFDENNGFVGGAGCFQSELFNRIQNGSSTIIDATEGGFSANHYVVDIDFYTVSFGLAASTGGVILRTVDAGLTWTKIPSNLSDGTIITAVEILDENICYATYSSGSTSMGLLLSTDGGLTWNTDPNTATFFFPEFYGLHETNNGSLFAGGFSVSSDEGIIFNTTDLENWNYETVSFGINSMSSIHDSIVFAVGDSGYIVVNQINFEQADIPLIQDETFEAFVFPNPSQGNIELSETAVSLQVFDQTGRIVYMKSNPGKKIDLSELDGGSYRIVWENDKNEVKFAQLTVY
jgi:photosystem II stability/assembly factor-like uncharacterized protein